MHALVLVFLAIGASDAKRLSGMRMSTMSGIPGYALERISADDKIHLNFQRQRRRMKLRQMKRRQMNRL